MFTQINLAQMGCYLDVRGYLPTMLHTKRIYVNGFWRDFVVRVSERNAKKRFKNIIFVHKPKYNGTKPIN